MPAQAGALNGTFPAGWERTLQRVFTGNAPFRVHALPTEVGAPSLRRRTSRFHVTGSAHFSVHLLGSARFSVHILPTKVGAPSKPSNTLPLRHCHRRDGKASLRKRDDHVVHPAADAQQRHTLDRSIVANYLPALERIECHLLHSPSNF